MKVIAQGAEAILSQKDSHLIKERIKKGYRLPEIDAKRRKTCTKREIKLLEKVSSLISVPKILGTKEMTIDMEFIKGQRLSDFLDKFDDAKRIQICKLIGAQVATLHDADIIHGDLTTSNMILTAKGKLYFIDFGLGFVSTKIEDKAVDLHLLKQALESKHYRHYESSFKAVLEGYKDQSGHSKEITQRLWKVEKRGRYKRKGK